MNNKKKIIFYCASHPFEVIYKIARLFKRNGYETVLFTMSEKDRFDEIFYSEAFDKIVCSNFQFFKPSLRTLPYILRRSPSFLKFILHLKFSKPYVIMGVSGANWQLKLIHRFLFKKNLFIYFPYDILSHSYSSEEEAKKEGLKQFEIDAERYCFENAVGIIHKGAPYELDFVKGLSPKELEVLSFMPYCSEEFIVPVNSHKLSKTGKEIHIVGIGNFSNEPNSKKDIYEFLKNAFEQKIHVHFYLKVSHLPKKEEENYIRSLFGDLDKSRFLHIHEPLKPREIIKEISKYDFGLWMSYGKDIPEVKFSMGNKVASYLEAGIPLIVDERAVFLNNLMKSYGLKISFSKKNLKNLKKILTKPDYKRLEFNVIKARQDFNMEKNFPRLEGFIEKLAEKRKNSSQYV